MIKLVTTFNNKLYNKYAKRFVESYNWPFDLSIYTEDNILWHPKYEYKNLFDLQPECKAFIQRNKDKKFNSFKYDGVRFCYKVYAYTHAILNENCDGLICMDADSVFYKSIDEKWIKKNIHRDNHMMSYLGRGKQYSECGFLYFNLKHPYIKQYAKFMKDLYDTDHIYNLKEQHDSFIWDYARKRFEDEFGIKNFDIGDAAPGHVQARSILGTVYDHLKGDRKKQDRSPEARI